MKDGNPILYIIAGPNGAGKTTFARTFLPEFAESDLFINADLIASGLSPLNPEYENVLAARLMLGQIEKYAASRKSFAFESTLSGKAYKERLQKFKSEGYTIGIYYIMLVDIQISLKRIEERVLKGGHNIPEVNVRRRFSRSVSNFLSILCSNCGSLGNI